MRGREQDGEDDKVKKTRPSKVKIMKIERSCRWKSDPCLNGRATLSSERNEFDAIWYKKPWKIRHTKQTPQKSTGPWPTKHISQLKSVALVIDGWLSALVANWVKVSILLHVCVCDYIWSMNMLDFLGFNSPVLLAQRSLTLLSICNLSAATFNEFQDL